MQPIQSHPKTGSPKVKRAMKFVGEAAAELTPTEVFEKGEFLGAGLMGGAYRITRGDKTLVAKQIGHEQSVTGMLNTHTQVQLQIKAQKQVAVQNALAMSGFPAPASAVLKADPSWVVMEESKGLKPEELSPQELEQGQSAFEQMKKEATPTIARAVGELKSQHPEHADLFGNHVEGGVTYARSDQGIIVNGFFDPVV